eukprot:22344-Alexandrium_andersonii.AAC.1
MSPGHPACPRRVRLRGGVFFVAPGIPVPCPRAGWRPRRSGSGTWTTALGQQRIQPFQLAFGVFQRL